MTRCRQFFSFVLVAGFLVGAMPRETMAQERSTTGGSWVQYNAERKNEILAAGLEGIPVLGHAYAGDVSRGYRPAAVSVGGLVLMILGSQIGCEREFHGACISKGNGAVITLGYFTYIGGRVWGAVSAYQTAEDYNRGLRQRLNLSLSFNSEDQPEIGVSVLVR